MNHNINYGLHLGNCGKSVVGVWTINCVVNKKIENKNDKCCQIIIYL